MKRLRVSGVAVALAIAVHAWQTPAAAAGFATQTFGGEHGSVVETNPTSLYYNPGAMGFSSSGALGVYGALALHSLTWTHNTAEPDETPDPAGAQGADTGKATLLNVFGGAAVGGTMHLTKNLVIGAGFFAPFYGISHWNKNNAFANSTSFPQAVDGVQRWFGYDGKIEVLYFTAGAAYRLGPISIGATGNFISSTLSLHQARNFAGSPNANEEGRSYFDVQGYNGSFALGAMANLVGDQLFIGASYQAQPGLGPQSLNGDVYIQPAGQSVTHDLVTLHQSLPDIIRAGFKVRPKSIPWEFRVFGDWTRWSVLTNQCLAERGQPCIINPDGSSPDLVLGNIRRDWNDSFGVRVGASYWPSGPVEVFAGGGFETAAVPDATMAPDIPDADNFQISLGGRFALTEMLFLTASYTHIQYLDRNVTDSQLESNGVMLYKYPTVEGNGDGQYSQWAGFFSGNLEAIF